MEENQQQPAGLGKLYVIRKDDIEMKPIELGAVTELHVPELEKEARENPYSNKGFTITGTARIETDGKMPSALRRLMRGDGRLPRKEKKRRMNKLLRNHYALMFMCLSYADGDQNLIAYAAAWMFPEKTQAGDGKLTFVLNTTPAQCRTIRLFVRRLPKLAKKFFLKYPKAFPNG